MEREILLRIVLVAPPTGVDYGLQKGRGNDYETVQTQRSKGVDLRFEFPVRVKGESLLGPFVQGPPQERFVYIGIGTYAGQRDTPWSRRLKVPLRGIDGQAGDVFETRVNGTGKDGTPTCATVKPFSGWSVSGG